MLSISLCIEPFVVYGFVVFFDEDLGEMDGFERVSGGWTAWIW